MFVFHVSSLFDAYIISVNQIDFLFYVAAVTALLAVAVPWLATKPQPKPGRNVWPAFDRAWKERRR